MIKEAAIRFKGKIYTGKRHCDILKAAEPLGALRLGTQGFITDNGTFIDREEAAKIAFVCGQIKKPKKMLFSEDLY